MSYSERRRWPPNREKSQCILKQKAKINKTIQPIRIQSDSDTLISYFWNHSKRDYALFNFGIYTGRRISDIVHLDVGSVAYIDNRYNTTVVQRLVIPEKKTGKMVELILHPSARRARPRAEAHRFSSHQTVGNFTAGRAAVHHLLSRAPRAFLFRR